MSLTMGLTLFLLFSFFSHPLVNVSNTVHIFIPSWFTIFTSH